MSNTWDRLERDKMCSNCSGVFPLDEFVKARGRHLGVSSWCRACARAASADWRARNRDRIARERREQYRRENPLPVGRRCVQCGGSMDGRRPDALVCGRECREARRSAQARERRISIMAERS